jgi:hypothetical protein
MDSYVEPDGDLVFITSLVFNQLWRDILFIGLYGLESEHYPMSPTTSTLRQYNFKS